MKRFFLLILSAFLLFTSCADGEMKNSAEIRAMIQENRDLILGAVAEMEAFGEERIYVAIELPKVDENEEVPTEEMMPRLVSFGKETDDRTEIENPVLEEALTKMGLELIFFQTGSDARRTVIFSFTRESAKGIQNGFYYTYDALPSGWWGRSAELVKKDNRYLQMNRNGSAWYYTFQLEDNFYYYEKQGSLLA